MGERAIYTVVFEVFAWLLCEDDVFFCHYIETKQEGEGPAGTTVSHGRDWRGGISNYCQMPYFPVHAAVLFGFEGGYTCRHITYFLGSLNCRLLDTSRCCLLGLASNARPWTSFLIIPFPLVFFMRSPPWDAFVVLIKATKVRVASNYVFVPFWWRCWNALPPRSVPVPPPPSSQVPQMEIAPRYKKRPRPSISRAPNCLLSCCCCGAMYSSHPLGRFEQYSSVLVKMHWHVK